MSGGRGGGWRVGRWGEWGEAEGGGRGEDEGAQVFLVGQSLDSANAWLAIAMRIGMLGISGHKDARLLAVLPR